MGQFHELQCDKEREFESYEVIEILQIYGATQEFAETDICEHNATAKSKIRTLENR